MLCESLGGARTWGSGRHQLHQPGHGLGRDRGRRRRRRGLAVHPGRTAGQGSQEGTRAERRHLAVQPHQSEDHSYIRRLIRHATIADHLDDQETRVQLRHYINQLNFIATLRARHLLDDELVKDLFYEPARTCWEQCAKTFVREIRATQNDDFARELQEWIGAPDP